MTKTTGNFTDFVSFSRASGGTALRRISYGNELVTNGTFDTDTSGWTAFLSTISWVSGKIRVQASTTGISARVADQLMTGLTVGKVYHLVGSVVAQNNFGASNGNASLSIRNTANSLTIASSALPNNTLGDISLSFVATETSQIVRLRWDGDVATTDASFDFDNISVKEVLFDRADGTLQLFNHPTNVPRVEYDASGNRKGLLIEEARTNLVPYSEAAVGVWPNTNATLTQLSNSYFGAFAGVRVASAGQTWHRVSHSNVSHTAGTIYTVTMYFAEDTSPTWALQCFNGSTTPATQVQLFGTFGSSSYFTFASNATMYSYSVEDLGNGVHKAQISYSINNSLPLQFGIGPNSTVVGDSIIALGAQLEAGAFPTSYIPTSGATATRAADICSIATSAFGYNQGAGTIVVDVAEFKFGTSGYPRAVELGNSSNGGERINIYVDSALQNYRTSLNTANALQANIALASSVISPLAPSKATLTYKTNDVVAAYSGSVVGADTLADITGTSYPRNTLKIGGSTTAVTDQINGHIKSIRYFPRRLTNAQIQALTA